LPSLSAIIPLFAVLILSLSFHEAAHAWTANRLGDSTARQLGRLTLNPLAHIDWVGTVLFPLVAIYSGFPLLGWAKPVPVGWHNLRSPRRDFAVIALAGPVSNLFLAICASSLLAGLDATDGGAGSPMGPLLAQTVFLNVLLAVFNLIPVPPLDGGNVLAGLVPEDLARVIDGIRPYGFLILYAMLFTGTLWDIVAPVQSVLLGWLLP
jgi:Zn-dependent protease